MVGGKDVTRSQTTAGGERPSAGPDHDAPAPTVQGVMQDFKVTDLEAAIAGSFKAPSSDEWLRAMESAVLESAPAVVTSNASRVTPHESDLTRPPSRASRGSQRALLSTAPQKSPAAELTADTDELAHLMARFERAAAVIRANELKHLVPRERARARKAALMHGEWQHGVHDRVAAAVQGRVTRSLCKLHGLQDPGVAVAVALGAGDDSSKSRASGEAAGLTKLELDLADPARQLLTRREREVRSVGDTAYVGELRRMGALVRPNGRYEMLSPLGLKSAPMPLGVLMASTPASDSPAVSSSPGASGASAKTRPPLATTRSASALLLPAASPIQAIGRSSAGPRSKPSSRLGGIGRQHHDVTGPGTASSSGPLASYHDGHLAFIQRATATGVPLSRVTLPPDSKFTASDALRQLEGGSESRHLRATLTRMEREAMSGSGSGKGAAGTCDTGDAITQLGLPKDLLSSDGATRPTLHPATWGAHLIEATTYAHPWPLVGDGVLGSKHPTVRAFAETSSAIRSSNRARYVLTASRQADSESHLDSCLSHRVVMMIFARFLLQNRDGRAAFGGRHFALYSEGRVISVWTWLQGQVRSYRRASEGCAGRSSRGHHCPAWCASTAS